jgi:hypothetical protein
LEDPNYGNLTLNSLLKIAAAFDIGLLVKFVPFSRLLLEFQDLSPKTLSVQSFIEELSRLKELAMERDDRKIDTNISIDTEDHRKYIEIPKNHILKMGGPSIYETLKTRSNMGLVVESTIT